MDKCNTYITNNIIQLLNLGLFTYSKLSNNILLFNNRKHKLFHTDQSQINMLTYNKVNNNFIVTYNDNNTLSTLDSSELSDCSNEMVISKDNCDYFDVLLTTFKSAKIFRDLIKSKLRQFLEIPLSVIYQGNSIKIEPSTKLDSIDKLDIYTVLYIILENFKVNIFYKDYSSDNCVSKISMYALNYSKLMNKDIIVHILINL